MFPAYLNIPREKLGAGTNVRVRVAGDMDGIARHLADALKAEITSCLTAQGRATFIIPVGPVDQYPLLADAINRERISCKQVLFIAMDEYLDDQDRPVPPDYPLSFRGFLQRKFYDLLDPNLAPPESARVFPDPSNLAAIPRLIAERGGVDACFGGIGITGHIAFNEPPEPEDNMSEQAFANLPTRVLTLTRETRIINSVTVGGEIAVIPKRAVTVGMKEILGAKRIRLYCNRPWQSAVIRRVLHGEITPLCPASLIRRHRDASVTIADYVAEPPIIKLR
jgi:glucosamine-6-phosphate deaminase